MLLPTVSHGGSWQNVGDAQWELCSFGCRLSRDAMGWKLLHPGDETRLVPARLWGQGLQCLSWGRAVSGGYREKRRILREL